MYPYCVILFVLYFTLLYFFVPFHTVCTILYSTIHYCTLLFVYCVILSVVYCTECTFLYFIRHYCTILYTTVLYCTVSYYLYSTIISLTGYTLVYCVCTLQYCVILSLLYCNALYLFLKWIYHIVL